ncbi:hypothetical protein HHL16_22240 [Pseudoflavitalea sp. G-6-1-2]|nr:hypothetical protein [Pseudoflavitalea sp. G-6-1-2]NML23616.1 hypothetical protein [Pseudoflavitalea sp. G-6-1-2]
MAELKIWHEYFWWVIGDHCINADRNICLQAILPDVNKKRNYSIFM